MGYVKGFKYLYYFKDVLVQASSETNILSVRLIIPFWVFLQNNASYSFHLFIYFIFMGFICLIVYSFIHKQMKDMQPIVYRQKTFHWQSAPCIMVFFFCV